MLLFFVWDHTIAIQGDVLHHYIRDLLFLFLNKIHVYCILYILNIFTRNTQYRDYYLGFCSISKLLCPTTLNILGRPIKNIRIYCRMERHKKMSYLSIHAKGNTFAVHKHIYISCLLFLNQV